MRKLAKIAFFIYFISNFILFSVDSSFSNNFPVVIDIVGACSKNNENCSYKHSGYRLQKASSNNNSDNDTNDSEVDTIVVGKGLDYVTGGGAEDRIVLPTNLIAKPSEYEFGPERGADISEKGAGIPDDANKSIGIFGGIGPGSWGTSKASKWVFNSYPFDELITEGFPSEVKLSGAFAEYSIRKFFPGEPARPGKGREGADIPAVPDQYAGGNVFGFTFFNLAGIRNDFGGASGPLLKYDELGVTYNDNTLFIEITYLGSDESHWVLVPDFEQGDYGIKLFKATAPGASGGNYSYPKDALSHIIGGGEYIEYLAKATDPGSPIAAQKTTETTLD